MKQIYTTLFIFLFIMSGCVSPLVVYNQTESDLKITYWKEWRAYLEDIAERTNVAIYYNQDTVILSPCQGFIIGTGFRNKTSAEMFISYRKIDVYKKDSLIYSIPPEIAPVKIKKSAFNHLYKTNKNKIHGFCKNPVIIGEKEKRQKKRGDKNFYLLVE